MLKLKSIIYLIEVLPAIFTKLSVSDVTKIIYQIQNLHLKHTKKKDFTPITYKLEDGSTIVVKFRNNDFYDTFIQVNPVSIDSDLLNTLKKKYM